MLLRQRFRPSTFFRIVMACVLISTALPWFVHPGSVASADWFDAVRGMMLGLALGLLYLLFRERRQSIPR
jgi:membrane associated rhomboid family serine protease